MGRSILYIDCFAGISGDMTVAALLDLGGDRALLEDELSKLGMDGEFHIHHSTVTKTGITAARFEVHTTEGEEHHDHHHKEASAEDRHEPPAAGPHEHGAHGHRAYRDIVALIRGAGLSEKATGLACALFETIAVAEAKIHGVPLAEVQFHEVGAVDSVVDIVSIAILVDALSVDRIVGGPVPVGRGLVRTQHGLYPIPAPATLEILKGYPIQASDVAAELTTPTGAAVLATLTTERGPIPSMEVQAVGYGAGSRSFEDRPNVLRLLLGSERNTERGR